MRITKYEHACLVIEEQGKQLVIDPGKFSSSLPDLSNVLAIVITHNHFDHFDKEHVQNIIAKNPEAIIYTTEEVARELEAKAISVRSGEIKAVVPFQLEFFGGQHELNPQTQNIGVLVNRQMYYPGDSYVLPKTSGRLPVLAAPASAPWLRVSEVVEFIKSCGAEKVFPTHNALLSDIGESVQYQSLSAASQSTGGKWLILKVGDTMEVN